MKPDKFEADIIMAMVEWGNRWYGFAALEADVGRSAGFVRPLVRTMRDKGFLTYETAYADDGLLAGSGYFLTDEMWRKFARRPLPIQG